MDNRRERGFPVAQQVKDPALSLWRLGLQLQLRFNPWPREFPYAMGKAIKLKKKKKKERKKELACERMMKS